MKILYSISPEQAKLLDTAELRERFLIEALFRPDELNMTYSLDDRMLVIGAQPVRKELPLRVGPEITGTEFPLERRELGTINLGATGTVSVDGKKYTLEKGEVLYVGKGSKEVVFSSAASSSPARFYALSGPAHAEYPTTKGTFDDANHVELGSAEACNVRTIHQFIHEDGIKSCNLVMGYTTVDTGSVWNTMPSHTHLRRMEVYCYFDLAEGSKVFHFGGEPTQTRHFVMGEGEAVVSPPWSIHAGVGTGAYSFVWGMLGENQRFTDMDPVSMDEIR